MLEERCEGWEHLRGGCERENHGSIEDGSYNRGS
jgi:hypothetical protein